MAAMRFLVAMALLVAAPLAPAVLAQQQDEAERDSPPAAPAEEAGAAEGDDAPGERGVRVLVDRDEEPVDAGAFPAGVTVLGERPGAADIDGFPEGVSPLGGDAAPGQPGGKRSVIRFRRDPVLDLPEVPDVDLGPGLEPDLGPAPREAGRTIGPNIAEQQEAFGQPPRPAALVPPPSTSWQPQHAFPERDPARPYPWNPAEWWPSIFDNTWEPDPAWPRAQDRRNWSPSRWIETPFDPTWTPRDAWNRTLGIADPRQAQRTGATAGEPPADAPPTPEADEPAAPSEETSGSET
jgi:hypothetical protein